MKMLLTLASFVVLSAAAGSTSAALIAAPPSETSRVSVSSSGGQGDYSSFATGISASGRYVAFSSDATTLVAGDTNGKRDAFVHDSQTGETTRVSVEQHRRAGRLLRSVRLLECRGDQRRRPLRRLRSPLRPTSSPGDTNEASDVFVHDRQTGETTRVSISSGGREGNGASGLAGDQQRRPLRRLHVGGVESRSRRHEPGRRCLRP